MNTKKTRIIIITVAAAIAFVATVFLHCFLISEGEYRMAKTVDQDPSLPHIRIGEVLFHAETFGHDTCQPVIVLHDGPGFDYRSLLYLKELSDEYYMIFYDRRGTGLSARVTIEELTPDTMLNDLLNVKSYYAGEGPVHLVGQGWAGELAKLFNASYPDQVVNIVLLNPRPSSGKTKRGFYYFRDLGMCWFRSLHVREPDPLAARDYLYSKKVTYSVLEGVQDTSSYFWRCSSQASKAFTGKVFIDANLHQIPIHFHDIPMGDPEKNIQAIRNYLNN